MIMPGTSLDDLQLINFPLFQNVNGNLAVFEGNGRVPFTIQRVFVVTASEGQIRGQHAHRQCTQVLVCLTGACRVVCDDGLAKHQVLIESMRCGVLIPPLIWAEQTYVQPNTTLMVLCDRPYEEAEYIRDYRDFLRIRQELAGIGGER